MPGKVAESFRIEAVLCGAEDYFDFEWRSLRIFFFRSRLLRRFVDDDVDIATVSTVGIAKI